MHLELQRADGVRHAFEVVALPVCEIVHGVGVPLRAGTVVRMMDYAVNDGVAEVHVGAGHVDFGAQDHGSLRHFAGIHLLEERQALLHRAVAVGAFLPGLRGRALLAGYGLGILLVHVGLALADEAHGEVPKLGKVVGSVVNMPPFVAQPADVFLYGIHVFHVFLHRVRVVEAQVADTAVALGDAEVHADGLGMPYVQVSVGLRRETGLQPPAVFTGLQVVFHYLFYEIQALLGRFLPGSIVYHAVCVFSFVATNSELSARKNTDFSGVSPLLPRIIFQKKSLPRPPPARQAARSRRGLRRKRQDFPQKAPALFPESAGTFCTGRQGFSPPDAAFWASHEREKTENSPIFGETCYKA